VPIDSTLSGDLNGAFTIEANINVNASGDGSLYGTFTFTSGEVTWTGHFGGHAVGRTRHGPFHGSGQRRVHAGGQWGGLQPGRLYRYRLHRVSQWLRRAG